MDRTSDDPVIGAASRKNVYSELYALAGRPRMRATILQPRALVQRYHLLTDSSGHPHVHEELRACIRDRDAERGAKIVDEHLEAACRDLMGSFKSGQWE